MVPSKMEFIVDWGDAGDSPANLKNSIEKINGVSEVTLKDGALVVVAEIPSSVLIKTIEGISGKRAVLQGYGDLNSAVSMISSEHCPDRSNVMGVVRLQESLGGTIVDATIDGLREGLYELNVHESGDLSEGCASLGATLSPSGHLGTFESNDDRADFRNIVDGLELSNIIGRGMSVSHTSGDICSYDKIVACGVIARSAGLFQNPKRICLCDGITVWDERHRNEIKSAKKPCCSNHKP